jgi:hypothetical protein
MSLSSPRPSRHPSHRLSHRPSHRLSHRPSRHPSSRAALLATGLAALLGGLAVVGAAPAAGRAGDGVPRPGAPELLATDLGSVDSLAVRDRVTAAVAGFGPIRLVSRGAVSTLVPEPTSEQSFWFSRFDGLSYDRDRLYLTELGQARETALATVYVRTPDGVLHFAATPGEDGHEGTANPDGINTYGYLGGLPEECAAQFYWDNPWHQYGIVYEGIGHSGPVATAVRRGVVYMADAGANDVVVEDAPEVPGHRTVAVFPPVVATMTAEVGGMQEVTPECALGHPYAYEATPTDIEIGRGGDLYVTTLSGGARDDDLRPLGRLYRVDAGTGALTVRADGFDLPRELAIGSRGEVYVAERSRVSVVPRGSSTPRTFLDLAGVTTLEVEAKALYLTTADGDLLRVPLRH